MREFLLGVPGKIKTLLDRLTLTRAGYLDDLSTILTDTADMQPKVNTINSRITANIATSSALATVDTNVDTLVTRISSTQRTTRIRNRTYGQNIFSGSNANNTYYDITVGTIAVAGKCVVIPVVGHVGDNNFTYGSPCSAYAYMTSTTNARVYVLGRRYSGTYANTYVGVSVIEFW